MKNKKLFVTLTILVNMITPAAVSAAEENNDDDIDTENIEEIEEALEEELQFYFGEVGHITEDDEYEITNPELLKERAEQGDEQAQELYEGYLEGQSSFRGAKSFFNCVLSDQYGWIEDYINGNIQKSVIGFVKDGLYGQAAKVLAPPIAKALGTTAKNVNIAVTAGSLAISLYKCRGKI